MFVFVIGFVFVFVILKGKIINLKLLYEISGKHKIDIYKYIFIYILYKKIGSCTEPRIRGFRVGPEAAG